MKLIDTLKEKDAFPESDRVSPSPKAPHFFAQSFASTCLRSTDNRSIAFPAVESARLCQRISPSIISPRTRSSRMKSPTRRTPLGRHRTPALITPALLSTGTAIVAFTLNDECASSARQCCGRARNSINGMRADILTRKYHCPLALDPAVDIWWAPLCDETGETAGDDGSGAAGVGFAGVRAPRTKSALSKNTKHRMFAPKSRFS